MLRSLAMHLKSNIGCIDRLAEVGKLSTPKREGKYETGQVIAYCLFISFLKYIYFAVFVRLVHKVSMNINLNFKVYFLRISLVIVV